MMSTSTGSPIPEPDLTQSDLDAADTRDLYNLRAAHRDLSIPDHVREAIAERIAELERRRSQAQLKRLQTGM
jgi:hypothetical protein